MMTGQAGGKRIHDREGVTIPNLGLSLTGMSSPWYSGESHNNTLLHREAYD